MKVDRLMVSMGKYAVPVVKMAVAVTFLFSAISKMMSDATFGQILVSQGLFTNLVVADYAGLFLIGLEIGIGLWCLQPFYLKKIVLPVGMFMVVMFTGYMAILAFEGETGNCGCFGDIVVMSPIQTIIKNIALLLGMVYLYFNVEERNEHVLDVAVIMVASLIVPGFVSPVLKSEGPPQGAVQQEGKAVIALKQFPIEKYNKVIVDSMGRKIDISVGTKLVAVFNMDCGYCRVEATGIGKLMKEAKKFPEMYCLYYGTTAVTEFEKNTQVKVPNKKITRDEYISLILENKSSTVYWLENGIAKAHWGDHMAQKLKEAFNL